MRHLSQGKYLINIRREVLQEAQGVKAYPPITTRMQAKTLAVRNHESDLEPLRSAGQFAQVRQVESSVVQGHGRVESGVHWQDQLQRELAGCARIVRPRRRWARPHYLVNPRLLPCTEVAKELAGAVHLISWTTVNQDVPRGQRSA